MLVVCANFTATRVGKALNRRSRAYLKVNFLKKKSAVGHSANSVEALGVAGRFSLPALALRRAAKLVPRYRRSRVMQGLGAKMGLFPLVDQFRYTRVQLAHDIADIHVIEPLPLPAILHGRLLVGGVPQFDCVRITFRCGFNLPEPHFFFQKLFGELFRCRGLLSRFSGRSSSRARRRRARGRG